MFHRDQADPILLGGHAFGGKTRAIGIEAAGNGIPQFFIELQVGSSASGHDVFLHSCLSGLGRCFQMMGLKD